ncbi:cation/H(+) antiporter 15-like [Abrus precatorius]|uniref:Cation/H(+) antiporter 15-like n=1 Tax=Abrus precatorius TaxID=3816 RepID=A0A8B8KH40_ABRPR|nr:cation/H(+) antiporter 15-like [Abrus precatorius]
MEGKDVTFQLNETKDITCYSPVMVTTNGIWQSDNPFNYALPVFILQIILVVTVTRLFVFILKPVRQPRVIAEIMGGIVLGPSVLGRNKAFSEAVFPLRSVIITEAMANIGLLLFTFLVGVGMDTSSLKRIGRKAVTIAFAGMVLPFAIGGVFSFFFIKLTDNDKNKGAYIIFLGVVLSITAFPVLARILAELKLVNTEIGRVALSSAIINDMFSWVLLAISITMIEHEKPSLTSLMILLSSAAFVAFNIFAVRPMILWIIRNTPEGETFSDFHICMILAGVMISGFITDAIGTHSILGAFIFGLTIPNGPLGLALAERLEDFSSGLLLPLFFANSGLKTDLRLIKGINAWVILILLVVLSCVGKVVGTLAVAVTYQMSISEGAVLGLLMNTKGLVEVIVLNIGKDQKVLTEESFASMMIITVLMTGIIVPGISFIYKPSKGLISYKRRTIQMSKTDAEFRILGCIHTPRNVPTIINLLEASNPTKKSPICIYVVHLVELTGRTSAMLVVHNPTKSDHNGFNRTQAQTNHIINAFENYEQHADYISIQPLTAVSPYSTMHEDICNLARDKLVALIIIPFHKQQTVDGAMEATNTAFRNVNQNVLNYAPCSVGILVDRGLNGSNHLASDQLSHHVAVLFFGGPDDREALSYGWRMSEHPGINLTVMRFVSGEEVTHHSVHPNEPKELRVETDKDIEKQIDEKLIHWFRMSHVDDDSVTFVEKIVNNGEQTVAAIRSMDDVHDLFIVGRGQGMISPLTAGLTDWSECPELGAIGDFLASSDFAATASVLVVQQYVGAELEEDGFVTTPNNAMATNEEYVSQINHHSATRMGHNLCNTEHLSSQ